jgi:hypothetical protein
VPRGPQCPPRVFICLRHLPGPPGRPRKARFKLNRKSSTITAPALRRGSRPSYDALHMPTRIALEKGPGTTQGPSLNQGQLFSILAVHKNYTRGAGKARPAVTLTRAAACTTATCHGDLPRRGTAAMCCATTPCPGTMSCCAPCGTVAEAFCQTSYVPLSAAIWWLTPGGTQSDRDAKNS